MALSVCSIFLWRKEQLPWARMGGAALHTSRFLLRLKVKPGLLENKHYNVSKEGKDTDFALTLVFRPVVLLVTLAVGGFMSLPAVFTAHRALRMVSHGFSLNYISLKDLLEAQLICL